MKALAWALLALSAPLYAGTWTAHPILPFGPLAPCHACAAGTYTVTWSSPADERTGEPFTIDHYVMVFEDTSVFTVQFMLLPADATSSTLTGLTSGDPYAVWLEAHGTDGSTHGVTPLLRFTAP